MWHEPLDISCMQLQPPGSCISFTWPYIAKDCMWLMQPCGEIICRSLLLDWPLFQWCGAGCTGCNHIVHTYPNTAHGVILHGKLAELVEAALCEVLRENKSYLPQSISAKDLCVQTLNCLCCLHEQILTNSAQPEKECGSFSYYYLPSRPSSPEFQVGSGPAQDGSYIMGLMKAALPGCARLVRPVWIEEIC